MLRGLPIPRNVPSTQLRDFCKIALTGAAAHPSVLLLIAVLLAVLLAPSALAAEAPVRISFIDSGISTKHIDVAHVLPGKNYVFPESYTEDRIGHGTATAGLMLGAFDQGVEGVCPDIPESGWSIFSILSLNYSY